MTILLFIIVLAILVLVHEFGHFIAAKKSGVLVEEFGFGFPPRLFGIKKGETLYSVNLIPLGGFVKVYGEEYKELQPGDGKPSNKEKTRAFAYKKHWQKAVIIVAGIVGNFLLAWVIISYLLTQGVKIPKEQVLVEKVVAGSPAATAGLQKNDTITELTSGQRTIKVTSTQDLIRLSREFAGSNITLNVLRKGREIEVSLTPRTKPPKGQGPLGIAITTPFTEKKYSWFEAPFYGFVESVETTKKIFVGLISTLGQFLTFGKPAVDVAGPIGIARLTGQVAKIGINALLEFIAILSLNLAVINIFPFPALDGGRLVFVIYEWVTRKRVNVHVERYTNVIGMIILLSLALLVSVNDILNIYK